MNSDQATPETKLVLVASFTWCFDEACQFSKTTHLLVSTSYVPLKTGNGVAISYTWGEFNRREVSIGHDETGRKISIILGCEWHESDYIDKLASMSYDLTSTDTAMPFWIDQLCIPQDDEATIRATLACIPLIFNAFDAIALLPGSPCKCLQKHLEEYGTHQASDTSQAELDQLSIAWAQEMGSCLNSASFCSHFERVWTRQEMLYTRKMHVEWTGPEVSCCVFPSVGDEDLMFGLLRINDDDEGLSRLEEKAVEAQRDLAPFARQVYQQALSEDITHSHALARVKMKHDKAWHNAVLAFEDFLSKDVPRTQGRYFAIKVLCQFLFGLPLHFIHEDITDAAMSDAQRLRKFASRLSGVGWVQRSATRQRDYVLAVWIDCPKYTIPEEYATMSLPLLLEDAILQLERNFKVTVPVTAFAGLFGCPRPSVFWRPTWYLGDLEVFHTQHVYGPVVSECSLLPIAGPESVPLNVYSQQLGRSERLMVFTEFIRGKTADQVLDLVRHVVMLWPAATIERISSARLTEFRNPLEGLSAGVKTFILMSHPVLKEAMSATVQQAQFLEAMVAQAALRMISEDFEQFHTLVFELVCEALGLSLQASRFRQSLCLIVHPGEHPAIGVCRQMEPDLGTKSSDEESSFDRITVCRDISSVGSGCTLLEAAKVSLEGELLPCYVGIGIWVPQMVTPWQDVGSLTDEKTQNALLI